MSSRSWCLTLNCGQISVPTQDEWKAWMETLGAVRWAAQVETGASGTSHVQAYINVATKTRLSAIKKVIPGAHLEPRKGSEDSAWAYCQKEDTRTGWSLSHGQPISGQGHRTDLTTAIATLRTHGTKRTATDHPETFVKYHRGLAALSRALNPATMAWRSVQVTVLWGDPGTGKTRHAVAASEGDLYELTDWPWFDGYDGQKHLLLDDFYGQVPYHRLLTLLDGYTRQWQVKGGFTTGVWSHIWITSNAHPDSWWAGMKDRPGPALHRRLHTITYMEPGNTAELGN